MRLVVQVLGLVLLDVEVDLDPPHHDEHAEQPFGFNHPTP